MTPTALVGTYVPPAPADPPFGGRPAYPDPRRPGQWRLCRTAWPAPGWQDDDTGVPPRCRSCGRSITPVSYRTPVGVVAGDGVITAIVRAWKHLPIRRRTPIYGEGAEHPAPAAVGLRR